MKTYKYTARELRDKGVWRELCGYYGYSYGDIENGTVKLSDEFDVDVEDAEMYHLRPKVKSKNINIALDGRKDEKHRLVIDLRKPVWKLLKIKAIDKKGGVKNYIEELCEIDATK